MADIFFEYGIPFPFYHINFVFPDKKDLPEPIKFPKSSYNLTFSRTIFNGRLKVLSENTFALYQESKPRLTIVGNKSLTFCLRGSIIKIESTRSYVYIKTRKHFYSYDYTTFKVWDLEIEDFCIIDDILYVVHKNFISAFNGEKNIARTMCDKNIRFIRGTINNLVIVTKDYKVIVLNRYSIDSGRLVYHNESIIGIEISEDLIALKTPSLIIVVGYLNKKVEKIRCEGSFKLKMWNNVIVVNLRRGAFKYFEIKNLQNSKTVLYEEIIGDFDIFREDLYVLTRSGIYSWQKDNNLFIKLNVIWKFSLFFNTIFKQHYVLPDPEKKTKLDFLDLGINELIKKDKQRLFNKKTEEDKTTFKFDIKDRKKTKRGGF